jgi:2,3-diketo-5-methylthiopentyl-1-phosphate enolase
MSIFKSENGRTLDEFREALRAQWEGGADLVKDDEIFMAEDAAPAEDRVRAARDLAEDLRARTGSVHVYVVNLSGYGLKAPSRAEELMAAGAEAFLVSPWASGLDVLADVASLPGRPLILSHPAFTGAFIGSSDRGVAPSVALGTLVRAAGADIGIFPSAYGSVALRPGDASAVGRALTVPGSRRSAWPAPSAGIHPGLVGRLQRDFGRDVVINAGGAIHGHPGGTLSGARAFRQAIDRSEARLGGRVVDAPPAELAAALARWGGEEDA